jgi:hypothetical protein
MIEQILASEGADLGSFEESEHSQLVLQGQVPGDRAMEIWTRLREAHPLTGVWPVFRGVDFPDAPEDIEPQAILDAVSHGTCMETLNDRLIERCENLRELQVDINADQPIDQIAAMVDASGIYSMSGRPELATPWPAQPTSTGPLTFSALSDVLTKQPHERVVLSLIATSSPSTAPAWLGFGGWNEVPTPEILVAVLRDWNQRFGATPACITGDTIECYVERPPQTERESLALAAEQWLVCEDIVGQGTQTIRSLAIELWRSPRWFFCWD